MTIKGSGIKLPTRSELDENHQVSFRRAIYLRRDVKEGEVILASDLIFLRPANGTDARDVDLVVGATSLRDIKAYNAIIHHQDYS